MSEIYTSHQLFREFIDERHSLGFVYKTDEGIIRRFLRDFTDPIDGNIEFTEEYVLAQVSRKFNQSDNTVLRNISAVNCFLDFVIRKGFKAYIIPPKVFPKEKRNFVAYIFTNDEINRILSVADSIPFEKQNPLRHYQLPVMFRILFNCGLRSSELLNLKVGDIDLHENVLTILNTKFHKSRLIPFSDVVSDAIKIYFSQLPPLSDDDWLFRSPKGNRKYSNSGLYSNFRLLLRLADIPYGGKGKGPRLHDIRHTFAVHCLNNWVLNGTDLSVALPILSRYLGHVDIHGTQKYLQLTSEMYPDIADKMEKMFSYVIPKLEVSK